MEIIVRNQTELPNKYVRFIKWKLYAQGRKFNQLSYARVFLNEEGRFPKKYALNVQLGVPGKDIVIKHNAHNPKMLMRKFNQNIQSYIANWKSQNNFSSGG